MSQPNLAAMRAVANRLDQLGLNYAFVGGSIVSLLVDEPGLSPARPTDDVEGYRSAMIDSIHARWRTTSPADRP